MSDKDEYFTIFPGDVIQVTNQEHDLFPTLLIVDEFTLGGVKADFHSPGEVMTVKLKWGEFDRIGSSRFYPNKSWKRQNIKKERMKMLLKKERINNEL